MDEQFEDFLLGGWWLKSFIKVDLMNDAPDAWLREAMVVSFAEPDLGWEQGLLPF